MICRQGKDAALIGYGSSTNECLAAASALSEQGVEVTVCDARFCKPLDTDVVRLLASQHVHGGAWDCSLMHASASCSCKFRREISHADRAMYTLFLCLFLLSVRRCLL